jgi:hypothetical protein
MTHKVLDKVLRLEDPNDLPQHLHYLGKSLFAHLDEILGKEDSASLQYLNHPKESWSPLTDLSSLLENLADPTDDCKHVGLFLPHLTTIDQMKQVKNLAETIRQLAAMHTIEQLHIITLVLNTELVNITKDFRESDEL